MNITLEIPLQDTVEQVKAKAYYTSKGASAESGVVVSEIADSDNTRIVTSAIEKAVAKLQGLVGIYAQSSITLQDMTLAVSLNVPANFDSGAIPVLQEAIKQYCENTIMYGWLALTSPQSTEYYAQQMVLAISDIRRALMQRTRPAYESDAPVYDTISLVTTTEENI